MPKFLSEKEQKSMLKVCLGDSKTIPSQSISLADMLKNLTTESYLELMNVGTYDEEANFDSFDFTKVRDITEFDDLVSRDFKIREAYENWLQKQQKANENKEKEVEQVKSIQNGNNVEISV